MGGNVSEWTRTAFNELPYDPTDGRDDLAMHYFGAPMVVRGGNFNDDQQAPLNGRYTCLFGSAMDSLGLRCVFELPTSLDEIEALL